MAKYTYRGLEIEQRQERTDYIMKVGYAPNAIERLMGRQKEVKKYHSNDGQEWFDSSSKRCPGSLERRLSLTFIMKSDDLLSTQTD